MTIINNLIANRFWFSIFDASMIAFFVINAIIYVAKKASAKLKSNPNRKHLVITF